MSRNSVLEYMTHHMRSTAMCETFIRVAAAQYPDLLSGVRREAARAMSVWLGDGELSAEVRWSGEEDCFVGQLRNAGPETVSFFGRTPIGLERAFEKAVRDYRARQAAPAASAEAG